MKNSITNALTSLIEILEPLDSEQRRRAIAAAMMALGETTPSAQIQQRPVAQATLVEDNAPTNTNFISHKRVAVWMRQNDIDRDDIESVFHVDDSAVEVIAASVPGSKSGQKSRNAYLLQGVAKFIETGDPAFDDRDARDLCDRYGFYDARNHTQYMKAIGNKLAGSKQAGWKLTGPGLSAAADLIKSMN